MWLTLKSLIIVFWLLSTTLLVRSVYFPDGAQLADVPAQVVLKLFLEHGTERNAMLLFHDDKRVGHGSLSARKMGRDDPRSDSQLFATGKIEKGEIPSVNSDVIWRFDLKLLHGEEFGGVTGQLRFPSTSTLLNFQWNKDEKLPHFELKVKGEVMMNDQTAAPFLAQAFAGQGSTTLPGGATLSTASTDGLLQMKSHEGTLKLAGQKQHGYVLEFTLMETYHAKAFFTEAGELALVELPEGYRLMESTVHNLEPGLDDVEDKPSA